MVGKKLPELERRRMILDAAAQIARDEGLENITGRRVAQIAGISPGLVFHHFGTKDGLLLGLLDDLLDRTLDAVELETSWESSAHDRLLALAAEEVRGLETQSANVELLFAYYFDRRDDLFRERIRAALNAYGAAFAAAAAEEIHADELADVVVSLIEGAAVAAVIAPDRFRPQLVVAALSAVVNAFGKEGPQL